MDNKRGFAADNGRFLKGLLKPFTGKGDYELLEHQITFGLKSIDERMEQLAARFKHPPYSLLPISLYRQSQRFRFYLRWRAEDETRAIGDRVLWALVDSNELPSSLRGELIAIEIERLTLNMQASSLANLSARAKVALQKVTAAESRLVSCS